MVEYAQIFDPAEIEYALIWKHPDGDLERYPNLKAVFSLGSGTDYLDTHKSLPDAPIFRLIDPNMADDMALYCLYWIIHIQRGMDVLQGQQRNRVWQRYPTPLAHELKVCVLGQGAIGSHISSMLARNGYDVYGWSRSPKNIDCVTSVVGNDALRDILPQMDIVISMLPSNPSTHKFLNKEFFTSMKDDSSFINISRGAVVDEDDLLFALDEGYLETVVLDVFATEPLPQSSPFWAHDNVYVTPHMSGATNPDTGVKIVAENILNFEKGVTLPYQYLRQDV